MQKFFDCVISTQTHSSCASPHPLPLSGLQPPPVAHQPDLNLQPVVLGHPQYYRVCNSNDGIWKAAQETMFWMH